MKTIYISKRVNSNLDASCIDWIIETFGEPSYTEGRWSWESHYNWHKITFNNDEDYVLFMLTHGSN